VPTFCRHNRFLERCPICSKSLPGAPGSGRSTRATRPGPAASGGAERKRARGPSVRVHREDRAEVDGYRSELVPGLRASADASRLAEEIAFSSGRLLALSSAPSGLYGQVRALAADDLEQATWTCMLIAYLSPLQGADPFAGIRLALREDRRLLEHLDEIPRGPRSSHDPARGPETLDAYRSWVAQSRTQALAFVGDSSWSPERRFERLFERLALPGFTRMARYELLVTLGRLGLYELRAGSPHFAGAGGSSLNDPATLAAKRLFAIGDPVYLDRRAAALAQAISVPIDALDLALANWGGGERATLGFALDMSDRDALDRARAALAL
jgi:Alpha-glutamyl/putrescinyl thymine pyrophosphorylase clade 3